MTIEELFGTLQQATVASWRKHLRTAKYAKHEALDEFYKELPEMVDALIEGYMGANGKKVKSFENILKSKNMNTLKYLQELKKVCKEGYDLLDDNEELEGLLDDIVNLINSTLYKVKELAENHSYPNLSDYILEALNINEAQAKGLTVSLKKDIDSYLRGMNTSDLKVLRDGWKEGDGNAAYDKMMHEMDMYLFAGIPGKFDKYKNIISNYIYGKILDRVGVNEANEIANANEAKKTNLEIGYVVDIIASLFPDMKWYKELKHNTVIDVLEYYALVEELAYNLDVTEDEFYDWIENNDAALAKELEDL